MKTSLLTGVLVLLFLSGAGAGQRGGTGLGFIVGEPSGLSAKIWTGRQTAIDLAAGWSLGHHDGGAVYAHGDWVWHQFDLLKVPSGQLPVYYGLGGRVILSNQPIVGARMVVGLEYLFPNAPLDAFVEIVPGLNILPSTKFDGMGGIGMRFFFKG